MPAGRAVNAEPQPMPHSSADFVVRTVGGHPDLLHLHQADPKRYPHLLQSVAHGTAQARFDILFAFPGATLVLHPDGRLESPAGVASGQSFLAALDEWWRQERCATAETSLPFRGGWMLYLGYELAAQIEPALRLPQPEVPLPTAYAVRCPVAVIRDHALGLTYAVAERDHEPLLDRLHDDLAALSTSHFGPVAAPEMARLREDPPERYLDGVTRVRRYVRDGDVFQVNLSRNWTLDFFRPVDASALYARLRQTNPAPFAALSRWQQSAIVSSSPERLVRVRGAQVETRPIAGTRPRGGGAAADRARCEELLAHPKERAEHIMLIDLERNDLGRVCVPGSIEVDELMALESYAHVHHIVSNVRGTLRGDTTPGEVIAAVFPGGTITGCPKVRCMEIIAELEQVGRGAYTGSLGYLNRDGDMDLNILIRTIVQHGEQVHLRAGAGIVADSEPQRELEETRAKARGMLLALVPEYLADAEHGLDDDSGQR